MSDQQGWTYTTEDGLYAVDKFTDEGKSAFILLLETDKEVATLRKTMTKLEMALRGFNGVIGQQLTDDMLVEEEEADEPVKSESHEI
jgi:hypothetical protein